MFPDLDVSAFTGQRLQQMTSSKHGRVKWPQSNKFYKRRVSIKIVDNNKVKHITQIESNSVAPVRRGKIVLKISTCVNAYAFNITAKIIKRKARPQDECWITKHLQQNLKRDLHTKTLLFVSCELLCDAKLFSLYI